MATRMKLTTGKVVWGSLFVTAFVASIMQGGNGVGAVLILGLYFIPSYIARNKHNADAIMVLNLLLGWTLIGWVIALIWASCKDKQLAQPA